MPTWHMGGALLVNAAPFFDPAISYCRQFGTEPTHGHDTFVTWSPGDIRGAKYGPELVRFRNFLELVRGLTTIAARGFAVLVNHGMSDAQGQPLGLSLPLTDRPSPWRVDEYLLGVLADLIGKSPSDQDLAKLEKSSTTTDQNTPIPPGTLKALHEALVVLRSKKLERLEIRACNLGGNTTVLDPAWQSAGHHWIDFRARRS